MRIAFLLEYQGKNFCGSQAQKDLRTVQSVLEEAIAIYFRLPKNDKPLRVTLSGRTDSGVHASGQVGHFDLGDDIKEIKDNRDDFDLRDIAWALNGILDADISVKHLAVVSRDFHARFSAIERQYVYRILNRPQRSPLLQNSHYFIRSPLDFERMTQAVSFLPGRHDFAAFKSANADDTSTLCDVNYAKLLNLGEGELEFAIGANHFVYNMIRIIVGTLVEIGLKKRLPESLKLALISGKRDLAGPTAPASGLSLVSVKYPAPYANIFNFAKDSKTEGKGDRP